MAVKRFSKYPGFSGDAIRFEAQVEVEAIAPLCRLMDIYEGVAFVRTKNPRQAIVEFWVSPFYIEDFRGIISALKREIPMVMLEERKEVV